MLRILSNSSTVGGGAVKQGNLNIKYHLICEDEIMLRILSNLPQLGGQVEQGNLNIKLDPICEDDILIYPLLLFHRRRGM